MRKKTDNNNIKGLIAAFILSFVLIFVVSVFSIGYGRRILTTLESGEKHFKEIASAATQVSSFAKRAEGHLMLYLVFHRESDRQKLPQRLAAIDKEIAVLDRLVKEDKAREMTEKIKSLASCLPSIITPLLAAHDREFQTTGRFEILNQQPAVLAAHDLFSQIREIGVDLDEKELDLENTLKTRLILTADKLRISLYIAIIGIIAVIFFLGIVLMRTTLNLHQEVLSRKGAELELKHSYETQAAVNKLLIESLGNAPVMEVLEKCLTLIFSMPWLAFESMGSIFLIEEEPDVLIMKVHRGFSDELKKKCAKLPFGDCLCGKAAFTAKLVFSDHIDADHTYRFKGMEEHGHYCVPIIAKNKVLGVLNIYVKHGHERKKFEETFLMTIANTLAGILIHRYGEEEKKKMEAQLRRSQKLESIGQLAAGISHEINTPIQYVGDNINFLKNAFMDLETVVKAQGQILKAAKNGRIDPADINKVESAIQNADLTFLEEEIPAAIEQSLEGVGRVSKIVASMKEFSHPSREEKSLTDINHSLENTITVAKNEWKYVAELSTDFDDSLPLVMCNPGELNQVFLNMIINASHSIADTLTNQPDKKGAILISTLNKGNWVKITISDTGKGIPGKIQDKIFDPFFTTKAVGKGTGQGLAISHSIVVDKHKGRIHFETREGKGTAFIIELPVHA